MTRLKSFVYNNAHFLFYLYICLFWFIIFYGIYLKHEKSNGILGYSNKRIVTVYFYCNIYFTQPPTNKYVLDPKQNKYFYCERMTS